MRQRTKHAGAEDLLLEAIVKPDEMTDGRNATLNPFTSIWLRPRATIQQVVDTELEQRVVALAALSGIVQALDNASGRNLGDHLAFPVVLGIVLIVGPILGVVGLYLWAWLLRWTGRWLGGQATLAQLRTATAWGSVPMIAAGVPLVLALLIVGPEFFTEHTPRLDARPTLAIVVLGLILLQVAMALWSIVTVLKTVAQVQGFSVWRSLANNLLPLLIIVAVGVAAALLSGILQP